MNVDDVIRGLQNFADGAIGAARNFDADGAIEAAQSFDASMLYGLQFEHLYVVLLIIPLTILLFLFLRKNKLLLISRFLIFSFVLLAIASPYFISEREIPGGETQITILEDRSRSMNMYPGIRDDVDELYNYLNESRGVELEIFSENEDKTTTGDALHNSIIGEKTGLVLLVSDGNDNYGKDLMDVASLAAKVNTTIHVILPEQGKMETDHGVEITGPKSALIGSEYDGKVVVKRAGYGTSDYRLSLYVDGERVLDREITHEEYETTKTVPFKYDFPGKGIYKLKAEITPSNDFFVENNIFHKTIKVVDKPEVLLVSESGSHLKNALEKFYKLRTADPDDLEDYDYDMYTAIVLDDIDADTADESYTQLRDYITSGGGLVVVGGRDSYDRGDYNKSKLELLLPVRSGEKMEKKRGKIGVVFAIDISGSTEKRFSEISEGDTKIDVEKALAIRMIRDLETEDYIGVLAFNTRAYPVSDLRQWDSRAEIEDRISRLKYGGGTYVYSALVNAESMLENFQGSKYIVLISDGRDMWPSVALNEAYKLADKGIEIYAVGVGEDTDEDFMKKLANAGNGLYFQPGETQRLEVAFGGLIEEREALKTDLYPLTIRNPHHFITDEITLSGSVGGFNKVTTKSNAQTLVTAQSNSPVITVWRFGTGRVVSLTTDNGKSWGAQVYEGKLFPRTVNWAIGDVEKGKKVKVEAEDMHLGYESGIVVRSKGESMPRLWVDGYEKDLRILDRGVYYAAITPDRAGFYDIAASRENERDEDAAAVNYPLEYDRVGINHAMLNSVAEATGGEIYYMDEVEGIGDYISEKKSTQRVREKEYIGIYFIASALTLFFIDVVLRRIKEILRLRS